MPILDAKVSLHTYAVCLSPSWGVNVQNLPPAVLPVLRRRPPQQLRQGGIGTTAALPCQSEQRPGEIISVHERLSTLYRFELTALQKKVAYALPTLARLANTKPKQPWVANRAMFSTSVTALRASAR